MINTLLGLIITEACGPGYITLEVNGIGYQVFVVDRTDISVNLTEPAGTRRRFFIHENIVAAQQGPSKYDLYGFETQVERNFFRALLRNCDKVGPSAAMKCMNVAPPEQLLQAIRMGNVKYLERGLGEKTAQNVILGMGKYAVTVGR